MRILTLVFLFSISQSWAQDSKFAAYTMPTPTLKDPVRGSVVGEMHKWDPSSSDLSQGSFTMPLPIGLPSDRSSLVLSPIPSYSPRHGLSEWGLGFETNLKIYRQNVRKYLSFDHSDEILSPWGRLIRSPEGDYYPINLNVRIKIKRESHAVMRAYLEDGTMLEFGGEHAVISNKLQVADPVWAWYLSRVSKTDGNYAVYRYHRNESGNLYVSEVEWGIKRNRPSYKLVFAYQAVQLPFVDFRSGVKLLHDQQVERVTVYTFAGGEFKPRYYYALKFRVERVGFKLTELRKTYVSEDLRSLGEEPPVRFTWSDANEIIEKAELQTIPWLSRAYQQLGSKLLSPSVTGAFDLDLSGEATFEMGGTLAQVKQNGDEPQIIPFTKSEKASDRCLTGMLGEFSPRLYVKVRGELLPYNVVRSSIQRKDGSDYETTITLCRPDGEIEEAVTVSDRFDLSGSGQFADLDGDRLPDLVQTYGGKLVVARNSSVNGRVSFEGPISMKLTPSLPLSNVWFQDLNGDGVIDIIAKHDNKDQGGDLFVWHGLGNMRFAERAEVVNVLSSSGSRVHFNSKANLQFRDLNRDGIPDLVANTSSWVSVYLGRGQFFESVEIPALSKISRYDRSLRLLPVDGSGELNLVGIVDQKIASLKISKPEANLLTSINDGKGAEITFDYVRAPISKGYSVRIPLLSQMRKTISGQGSTSRSFEYQSPVIHSGREQFLGFKEVKDSGTRVAREFVFKILDETPALLSSEISWDPKRPDFKKSTSIKYLAQEVLGLEVLWPKERVTGILGVTTTETIAKRNALGCEQKVISENTGGQVVKSYRYYDVANLDESFSNTVGCLTLSAAQSIPKSGQESQVLTERDPFGRPLKISMNSKTGNLILQEITYDDWGHPIKSRSPFSGTTQFGWDDDGRIKSLKLESGKTREVTSRSEVTDAILGIKEFVSGAEQASFQMTLMYDEKERLRGFFSSLGSGSETNPDHRYLYKDTTMNAPGSIETISRINNLDGSLGEARLIDLMDGAGNEVARLAYGGSGYVATDLTKYSLDSGITEGFAPKVASSLDVDWSALYQGAKLVESQWQSLIGFDQSSARTIQTGKMRTLVTHSKATGHVLEISKTENGKTTETQWLDSEGRTIGFRDGAGKVYRFERDALGRLICITLPDGITHRVTYDDLGRVVSVVRDNIGSVHYRYDASRGLLHQKTIKDVRGQLVSQSEFHYDQAGRVIETQVDGETYRFSYQGDRVTFESGPKHEIARTFRPDGKVIKEVASFQGLGEVETTYKYTGDGSLGSRAVVVKQGSHTSKYIWTFLRDSVGRPEKALLNGAEIYHLTYDDLSRLSQVKVQSAQDLIKMSYDPTTEASNGFERISDGQKFGHRWELNERGLFESEKITTKGVTEVKNYQFDERRFLSGFSSGKQSDSYQYTDNGEAEVSALALLSQVKVDAFGRVTQIRGSQFVYGPHGRVSRVTGKDGKSVTYHYNAEGVRVLKVREGQPEEAYYGSSVLLASQFIEPISQGGTLIGYVVNGKLERAFSDARNTVTQAGDQSIAHGDPWGVRPDRDKANASLASVLDFVGQGYDADLGAYRMDKRDYDPVARRFLTPDPLLLEEADMCAARPHECNLFSYAGNNPVQLGDKTGQYVQGLVYLYVERAVIMAGATAIAMKAAELIKDLAEQTTSAKSDSTTSESNDNNEDPCKPRTDFELNSSGASVPEEHQIFRYVGEGEAQIIMRDGVIPNVDAENKPKDVHFSKDKYTSAKQAENALKIGSQDPRGPKETPKYRVTADRREVKLDKEGKVEGGTGHEATTKDCASARQIEKLEK